MKCTGLNCPMQHGYDVENCKLTDCKYKTLPITNYDRIRNMSIEEMANFLMRVNNAYDMECMYGLSECKYPNIDNNCSLCFKDYLESEVEE